MPSLLRSVEFQLFLGPQQPNAYEIPEIFVSSHLHHLLVILMAMTLILILITFDIDNCNNLWLLSLLIYIHIISRLFSLNHHSESPS